MLKAFERFADGLHRGTGRRISLVGGKGEVWLRTSPGYFSGANMIAVTLLRRLGCTVGFGITLMFSAAHAEVSQAAGPDAVTLQSLADRVFPDSSATGTGPTPDRAMCGTAALMTLRSRWNDLPEKTRTRLALVTRQAGRPATQAEYISPSGHFCVHYDTTGANAVDPMDDNQNEAPDYIEEVGATADSVWSMEIDRFGFHPPPSNGTAGGGQGQYDIYIQDLGPQSLYGATYPENILTTTTTSYIELDNNYTDPIYSSRGRDGLHVTLAHEFFHAIQFGYYSQFDAEWWQEVGAVRMEDFAYPEVKGYYQYLPSYFNAPTVALDRFFYGDYHPYGSVVFVHNLTALFGIAPIRQGWERLAEKKDWKIDYIDEVLDGGFEEVFPRFAVWNYFTGARARPGYYPAAEDYPPVKAQTVAPGLTVAFNGQVGHLSADYLQFRPGGQSGGLSVSMTLDARASWKVKALLIRGSDAEIMETDGKQVRIPSWGQYDEIVIVPVCLSLTGTGFTYSLTAEVRSDLSKPARAVGDFNIDGVVDIRDFFGLVETFDTTAASSGFDPRYDLNGDGAVNLDDFFLFAGHFGETGE